MPTWQKKIEAYCNEYQIPIEFLPEILFEPKVVPMIRGKAFEFSAMTILRSVLPSKTWHIEKTPMNAQQGIHDIDVAVIHKPTNKKISVECKLAAKGRFKVLKNGEVSVSVK